MKRYLLLFSTLAVNSTLFAQAPQAAPGTESGFRTFQTKCMSCHGNPAVERAPSPNAIRELPPERIYEALTTGVMQGQGQSLTDTEKRMLALFMSGRPLGSIQAGDAKSMPNQCPGNPAMTDPSAGPEWNGWGVDAANTRYQTGKAAGLTAADVPNLKLKWAFGFPTGVSAFGQPTLVSGRIFVGTDIGYIYSIDAASGCVYWSFQTRGSVRNALTVGPVKGRAGTKYAVYFGDAHANVYALDAQTGKELWTERADDHFTSRITGAPALHDGRLYVPVSSSEEFSGSNLDYGCCTFRGAVVAFDGSTGKQVWKTFTVDVPKPTKKNSRGVQQYAPGGVAVWNTPTVDPKRHAIYFGTGDSETEPAAKTSDAVMALDMNTGKMLWVYQAQENDAFLGGCNGPGKTENCPSEQGPDWDIGNSPVLRTLPSGKRIVVAGTKNGDVFALDPDNKGAKVWRTSVVPTPQGKDAGPRANGIVWGGAADERNAYYGLSGGGMVAVQLATGERLWYTEFPTEAGARVSNAAAATAIPGVAFVGGTDGKLHAVATADGKQIWEVNTDRTYETVNKVPGKGGAMGSAGPTVAGGMVFVGAGYGVMGGKSGNVLLAFSAK